MLTASDEEKLDYILKTIDPTPKIFQYWKDTSPVRKHDFDEENMEIRELFENYRCLYVETFLIRWPLIISKLAKLLQRPRMTKKGVYCALVQELKHLLPGIF